MANLFGNSNGTSLAGWEGSSEFGGIAVVSVATEVAFQGMHSLRAQTDGINVGQGLTMASTSPYARASVSPATTYTISAYVYYIGAAVTMEIHSVSLDASGGILNDSGSSFAHAGRGWQRQTDTRASHASAVYLAAKVLYSDANQITFFVDAAQCETGSSATAYLETGTPDLFLGYTNTVHGVGAGW